MVVVVVAIPLLSSSVACCSPVGVHYEDALNSEQDVHCYLHLHLHLHSKSTKSEIQTSFVYDVSMISPSFSLVVAHSCAASAAAQVSVLPEC